MTLFAFDNWREAYAAADELTRAPIRENTAMYDGLWNAMYFLLLIGFAVGNSFRRRLPPGSILRFSRSAGR